MSEPAERSVSSSEFAERCLALVEEVARTGRAITITKQGQPVARVLPPDQPVVPRSSLFGLHKGRVYPLGEVDLDVPVVEPGDWAALGDGPTV